MPAACVLIARSRAGASTRTARQPPLLDSSRASSPDPVARAVSEPMALSHAGAVTTRDSPMCRWESSPPSPSAWSLPAGFDPAAPSSAGAAALLSKGAPRPGNSRQSQAAGPIRARWRATAKWCAGDPTAEERWTPPGDSSPRYQPVPSSRVGSAAAARSAAGAGRTSRRPPPPPAGSPRDIQRRILLLRAAQRSHHRVLGPAERGILADRTASRQVRRHSQQPLPLLCPPRRPDRPLLGGRRRPAGRPGGSVHRHRGAQRSLLRHSRRPHAHVLGRAAPTTGHTSRRARSPSPPSLRVTPL